MFLESFSVHVIDISTCSGDLPALLRPCFTHSLYGSVYNKTIIWFTFFSIIEHQHSFDDFDRNSSSP